VEKELEGAIEGFHIGGWIMGLDQRMSDTVIGKSAL
jgi:hypothetical protein